MKLIQSYESATRNSILYLAKFHVNIFISLFSYLNLGCSGIGSIALSTFIFLLALVLPMAIESRMNLRQPEIRGLILLQFVFEVSTEPFF